MKCIDESNKMREVLPTNILSIACKRKVCGVGINDADYIIGITINGKQVKCPAYSVWAGMIFRCYGDKACIKHPTYKNVTVCEDWHRFMNFRSWWINNAIDGYDLDKDILSGEDKIYSPSTCAFVSRETNSFLTSIHNRKNGYMTGVTFEADRNKFGANISNPISGRKERIGRFSTELEAHNAWAKRKCEIAMVIASKQDRDDVAAAIIKKYAV